MSQHRHHFRHRCRTPAHLPTVPELARKMAVPQQAQQAAEDPELDLSQARPEAECPGTVRVPHWRVAVVHAGIPAERQSQGCWIGRPVPGQTPLCQMCGLGNRNAEGGAARSTCIGGGRHLQGLHGFGQVCTMQGAFKRQGGALTCSRCPTTRKASLGSWWRCRRVPPGALTSSARPAAPTQCSAHAVLPAFTRTLPAGEAHLRGRCTRREDDGGADVTRDDIKNRVRLCQQQLVSSRSAPRLCVLQNEGPA